MPFEEQTITKNPEVQKETREAPRPGLVPREMSERPGASGAPAQAHDKPTVIEGGKLTFTPIEGYQDGTIGRQGNGRTNDGGNQEGKVDSQQGDKSEKAGVKLATVDAREGMQPKEARDGDRDANDRAENDPKKVLDKYSSTLQRAGYSERDAKELATQTYDNFKKLEAKDLKDKQDLKDGKEVKDGTDKHLRGTPEEQMNRLSKAAQDVLDKNGVERDGQGRPTGNLGDGQVDYLSDARRRDMVKDMANRFADPKLNVVQGEHFTCALESMQKQLVQGGDPAALAEQVASLANTGKAEIHDRKGNPRTVEVDSRSLAPDAESGLAFRREFGREDVRGMFGQASDALIGQVMADRKSEREGLASSQAGIKNATYKYMAAHGEQVDRSVRTETGEGLYKKGEDGQYHIARAKDRQGNISNIDSPGATLWDVADTNRAMGGAEGAVFAHRKFAGSETPPPNRGFDKSLRITTFGSNEDLSSKLTAFGENNGQSAQLMVDAPYLPGGGQAGHGLHMMNASMNADGKTYNLDNNWNKGADIDKAGYNAIDRATNPDNWNNENGRRPDIDTIIRPGTGRDPSESQSEFQQRREREKEAENKLKEEEKHKEEERARRKAEELKEEEKRAEENKARALKDEERAINQTLQALFDAAMGEWRSKLSMNNEQFTPPPPRPEAPARYVA